MECKSVQYFDSNGNDQEYVVGIGGITSIKRFENSPEPYCTKFYVEVYKDNKLFCELHTFKSVYFL